MVRHERPATSRQPWRIIVKDDTGIAELVFFKFTREAQTPPGAKLLVSGKLDVFNGRLTIAHPEHLVPIDQPDRIPVIEPVWPLTAGLWPRQIAAGLAQALELLPRFPGMARPGAAEAGEMAAVRGSVARRAGAARRRTGPRGCAPAWPTTNSSPDRSRRR